MITITSIATLFALIAAVSILCIGSLALINAVSTSIFSHSVGEFKGGKRYQYYAPSSEYLRERIRVYPAELKKHYILFCSTYIISVVLFIGLENVDSALIWFEIDKTGILGTISNLKTFVFEFLFPASFSLAVLCIGYIVFQALNIFLKSIEQLSRVLD